MSRTKNLSKELREERPDLVALAEEADSLHDIKALYDSQGGKYLVSLLIKDVVANFHKIISTEDNQRDALCERAKANLNLVRLIIKSEENEQHLDEMLADALAE